MKALNEIPDAWRLAIQRERDAYDFYARMAQAATDEGTRSLFEMLVEQEKRHEAILGCEPCHVMEDSTLADPDVVEAINAGFIPILVDADKRPDVDSRYNKGGWPTTAFLNAEGDVLESHNFLTSEQMAMALRRVKARYAGEEEPTSPTIGVRSGIRFEELEERPEAVGALSPELPETVAQAVVEAFDREHGGFGGAPKFHHADVLEFGMAMAHRTGDEALAGLVHRSLEAMAQGGLYDDVDGGFFRYSTTDDWSVPHYEKMVGDQAQLITLYLHAYQASGRRAYLDTAQGVLGYVDSALWDRSRGYFCSSQEADPDYYGLDADGRADRAAPYVDKTVYTERNAAIASAYMRASAVLNEPRYADLAIRALDFVWQKSYQEGLGMYHYYDNQPHVPGLLADQVSIAQAFLDAYEHFGREVYLQRAETLIRFAKNALRDGDGRYYDTVAAPEAVGRLRQREKPFCENVAMAQADLRLHRLTGREEYRESAQQTLEALLPFYPDMGFEAARFALAVDRFLRRPLLVTVVGETEDPARAELLRAGRRAYAPNKTVQAVDPVWEQARLARLGYPASPAPAAYVCLGTLCARPTADPDELLAQAQAMVGHERKGRGAWEYKGYSVDEGFKPEPRDRFQYFFRVLKGDERVFRYCIWTSKEAAATRWPDMDLETEAGQAELEARLRAEGHTRIQAKIDAGTETDAFENWLLDLRGDREEEVILEEKDG
jgi:uncharacterized protein YyaL (SSP411 family)